MSWLWTTKVGKCDWFLLHTKFGGYSLFTPKEISCQNLITNITNVKILLYKYIHTY